jgi:multidrug resistance protein MdtO
LTTYLAFLVVKPDRTTSVIMSIVMLLLFSIIIGLLIPISMAEIDQPAWRVVSMVLISFGLLFLASASKLKPVGSIIALMTAYALDLLSKAQIGELATRALLYAWLFLGIPVSTSVSSTCCSVRRHDVWLNALSRIVALAAAILRGPDPHQREAFAEALSEGTGEMPAWLRLAGVEKNLTGRRHRCPSAGLGVHHTHPASGRYD